MIAVAHGAGLQIRDVRSARGLGDGERMDLLACEHGRGDAFFQLLRSDGEDRRQADGMDHQAGMQAARARARHLLGRDHAEKDIDGRAAIFLGKAHAEEADRGRLSVQLARELARLVPVVDMGHDFLLDERAQGRPPGAMILCVMRPLIAMIEIKRVGAVGKTGGHGYPSLLFLIRDYTRIDFAIMPILAERAKGFAQALSCLKLAPARRKITPTAITRAATTRERYP